jgi:hypothetical protein
LHNGISFFIHFVPGAFLVNWRCLSDSIPKVFSYLQFLQSPSLLNFYFTSIYYRSIDRFYLHSKLDRSKKLVSVTRITGIVIFTGHVILNHEERHNRVVITNAHATSILNCDRITSQNSRRISRPYNKKMSGFMTNGSIVWGAFLSGAYWFKKIEVHFNMSFSIEIGRSSEWLT